MVADLEHCTWVLVPAVGPDGATQVLVRTDAPGVDVHRLEGLDVTRAWGSLRLDSVPVETDVVVGRPGAATDELVADQLRLAAVLTAAESVGAMHTDFGSAVQYAKDRIAFGRPIGSFQGLKHLIADASLGLEMATGLVAAAAEALGAGAPDGAAAGPRGQGVRGRAGRRAGPRLLPGLRRHRVHVGARPAPVPPAPGRRRGGVRVGPLPPITAPRGRGGAGMTTVIDRAPRPTSTPTAGRCRAWLAANLERRPPGESGRRSPWELEEQTDEQLADGAGIAAALYEAGYAGITWPAEYGGQGLTREHELVFQDEARGYVLPDLGIAGGATFGVCAPTMIAHASPEFLRRHIPRVLAGDLIVSQFFSDPDAGSDLAGVRTQAVRDGDRWILTGSKIWSSGAYYADAGMCLARTNWDVPKHRGLTWFLVPVDAPGLTIERIRQINGDAEFCQEYLDEVELSDDDVIGEVDAGWSVTQTMLLHERGAGSAGGATSSGRDRRPRRRAGAGGGGRWPRRPGRARRVGPHPRRGPGPFGVRPSPGGADDGRSANAGNLASYGKLASGVYDPIRANRALRIAGDAALAWDDPAEPRCRRGDGPAQQPLHGHRRRHRADAAQHHRRAGPGPAAGAVVRPHQAVP